jgi:hypothetical protein
MTVFAIQGACRLIQRIHENNPFVALKIILKNTKEYAVL